MVYTPRTVKPTARVDPMLFKPIPEETRAKVREMLSDGATVREVAKATGVSEPTIRKIRDGKKPPLKSKRRPGTAASIRAAIEAPEPTAKPRTATVPDTTPTGALTDAEVSALRYLLAGLVEADCHACGEVMYVRGESGVCHYCGARWRVAKSAEPG